MAIFRKKSLQEVEREIKKLEVERLEAEKVAKLKGELWSQRKARAKGVLAGMSARLKELQKEVGKAYTPEAKRRAQAIEKNLTRQ